MTSETNWSNGTRQRVSPLDGFDRLIVYVREYSSVLIENTVPSKYGWRSSTAHTMTRNSLWVVSFTRPALGSEQNQYPIRFVDLSVISGCFWSSTNLTCTSLLSVLRVSCLSEHWNANDGGETNICWQLFFASHSASCSTQVKGWSFRSLSLCWDTIIAKFDTNPQNSQHSFRDNYSSVAVHEDFSILMAFVECDANLRRLVRMKGPKQCIDFVTK